MGTLGTILQAIIDTFIQPTWHLVVFYIFLFALVAWKMIKSWGF